MAGRGSVLSLDLFLFWMGVAEEPKHGVVGGPMGWMGEFERFSCIFANFVRIATPQLTPSPFPLTNQVMGVMAPFKHLRAQWPIV